MFFFPYITITSFTKNMHGPYLKFKNLLESFSCAILTNVLSYPYFRFFFLEKKFNIQKFFFFETSTVFNKAVFETCALI